MKAATFFLLLCCASLLAEDIYIAQNAAGADDGSSAENAKSLAWATNAANWGVGAGKISAGDTAHGTGTFTNAFTFQGSGTAGNPITFLFEPDCKFSAPAWPSDAYGAIHAEGKSWLFVDGGSNGRIECTDNGTSLTFQNYNDGVAFIDCSFVAVGNLEVRDMYQRTGTVEAIGPCVGIRNTYNAAAWNDFTVTNCIIGNCYYGIWSTWGIPGASNVFWSNNLITNCNWGMGMGDAGAGTMRNVRASGNTVSNFLVWDDTMANEHHHNGFYGFAENGGHLADVIIDGNRFGPGYGTYTTGGIFLSGGLGTNSIYNNLFLTDASGSPNNGHITYFAYGNATFLGRSMNNTIKGAGGGIGIYVSWETIPSEASSRIFLQNNIIDDVETAIALFWLVDGSFQINHNTGYSLRVDRQYSSSGTGSANYRTFEQWQTENFLDINGSSANPLLNSAFVPSPGSPVNYTGTNLLSFFNNDHAIRPRLRVGSWTVGAFEYQIPAPSHSVSAPTVAAFTRGGGGRR